MKKVMLVLVAIMMVSPAYAGFQPAGQNAVTGLEVVTKMPDESFVTVEGNIVKQIGKEKYLLKNGNATIAVDIDDELIWNVTITPNDKVRITGEVDRDFRGVELEASRVEIIK